MKCYIQELSIVDWKEKLLCQANQISSASSYINACFGRCSRITNGVIHSESAFSSGIVRIYWCSHDSAIDFLPFILWSNVKWDTLFTFAASHTK